MMQRPRSIRFVLTLWYSLILLGALCLFAGTLYVYLQHLLEQRLEQDLAGQVDWIYQLLAVEEEHLQSGQSSPRKLSWRVRAESSTTSARTPATMLLSSRNRRVTFSFRSAATVCGLNFLARNRRGGRISGRVQRGNAHPLRIAGLSVRHFIFTWHSLKRPSTRSSARP